MSTRGGLPPDWKQQTEGYLKSLPKSGAYLGSAPVEIETIKAWLGNNGIARAAEALWEQCVANPVTKPRLPAIFFQILGDVLDRISIHWSEQRNRLYGMEARTRKEWRAVARALEVVRADGMFFQGSPWAHGLTGTEVSADHVTADERLSWSLDEAIRVYHSNADGATNHKKDPVWEREVLESLRWLFREDEHMKPLIRNWIKATAPFMRALFGPQWTEVYTKRRASDWKITMPEVPDSE